MRSPQPLRPQTQTEVPSNGAPRQVLVTPCCGARLWLSLGHTQCPMCWRPLGTPSPTIERKPAKVHTITRYWS